tara:strand:+ start:462 stop:1343 length:882 start_codon:yes stop_codon:yes gene_type:complete
MTYNKKIVNKSSITKKSLWSLILAAKEMTNSGDNLGNHINIEKTIGGKLYYLQYNKKLEIISKSNFMIDTYEEKMISLFLPIIFNNSKDPYLIAHLAQTMDGYIATKSGESKYISSNENLIHLHMIRAISDVILVGNKTVELDNPMLTTRLVRGPNPMRVIIDKDKKLSNNYNVFKNSDENGYRIVQDNIITKLNNIFQLPLVKNKFEAHDICILFKKLQKKIVFIEGGGTTISDFYSKNKLNRLHVCISPSILGKGRSSFILEKKDSLEEVIQHETKYFEMGQDILCDIKLS